MFDLRKAAPIYPPKQRAKAASIIPYCAVDKIFRIHPNTNVKLLTYGRHDMSS